MGDFTIDQPGWFLIRVLTENTQTYRFAMTGPFYVHVADKPDRISRDSARFFLDWAEQAVSHAKQADPQKQAVIDSYHQRSVNFWQNMLNRANFE